MTPDGMPIFDSRVEVEFKVAVIDPDSLFIIQNAELIPLQITYITQLTQMVTFGFTKVAVIVFYRRYRASYFGRKRWQTNLRTRIFSTKAFSAVSWVMMSLVVAWTVAFFVANLLECLPISENWNLEFTPNACIRTSMMYLAQAWSDVFTDVLILSMPLPWVCELVLSPSICSSPSALETPDATNAQARCGVDIPARSTVSYHKALIPFSLCFVVSSAQASQNWWSSIKSLTVRLHYLESSTFPSNRDIAPY